MITGKSLALRLDPNDNVAIARNTLSRGSVLSEYAGVVVGTDIPAAHKVAIADIEQSEPVRRYGQIIGFATQPIQRGEHVHTHNVAMGSFQRDHAFGADARLPEAAAEPATFLGFMRPDGRVATRNYIGVVSTVNCSSSVTKLVVEHFSKAGMLDAYPNVDGVVPVTHSFGCCIDHNGDGVNLLRRTLGGYVKHANFAGVVVIGLGCEANQMGAMFLAQGIEPGRTTVPLVIRVVMVCSFGSERSARCQVVRS